MEADGSPTLSDKARALYAEGIKAADAKNWAAAHQAFLEAWKQNEHYQIAANLGSMEIKLGRYRDAAEHLAIYLRKAPSDKVKDRMRALAFFEEAKKKVGTVQVTVNVNGAEILVDDKVVAISPPMDDIFVDPGPRFIKARLTGHKAAETTIEAAAGSTHQVPLSLEKLAAKPEPPPALAPAPAPALPPAQEPFKPKKELIIAGIAVGAVGLVGGTIFALVSSGQASAADERLSRLQNSGGQNACAGNRNASDCETLHDLRSGRDTFGNLAAWSFLMAGLAGGGTAVYALVLPKVITSSPSSGSSSPDASSPEEASKPQARVVPAVMPSGGGLFVTGAF